ncbi:MAG: hypothetical protein HYW62_02545 [Candidatus Levybacteria bacterium]|nr:hypothetical protein [Candidatus Levybacteria bacterium]
MKKPALIITFLIGVIVVLSIVRVVVYNRLSTSGVLVGELEEQISLYKTQNAILAEEVLSSSSLTSIVARAQDLGFTNKDKSLLVIKTSRPLAVKR